MAADLVQKWRDDADNTGGAPCNNEDRGYSNALYACADELEAALRAEAGAVGWKNLASAPRDGTNFWLCADIGQGSVRIVLAHWDDSESEWPWNFHDAISGWDSYDRHTTGMWIPLIQPEPPRPSQKD